MPVKLYLWARTLNCQFSESSATANTVGGPVTSASPEHSLEMQILHRGTELKLVFFSRSSVELMQIKV